MQCRQEHHNDGHVLERWVVKFGMALVIDACRPAQDELLVATVQERGEHRRVREKQKHFVQHAAGGRAWFLLTRAGSALQRGRGREKNKDGMAATTAPGAPPIEYQPIEQHTRRVTQHN
jgi:hypothetical protein